MSARAGRGPAWHGRHDGIVTLPLAGFPGDRKPHLGVRVFRSSYRRPNGQRGVLKRWYLEARFRGKAHRIPGTPDYQATHALGRKLERIIAHREVGERLPADLARFLKGLPARLTRRLSCIGIVQGDIEVSSGTLAAMLDGFEGSLRNNGNTARHALQRANAARRVLLASGTWDRIAPQAVEERLAALRLEGRGITSSNAHLAAARQFCKWAIERALASEDPLRTMRPMNARVDRKVERRALTEDELRRLLQAAENGPVSHGIWVLSGATVGRTSGPCGCPVCASDLTENP